MSVTEIKIDECGEEMHESWLLVRASRVQGSTTLFDSDIQHHHWIEVSVSRCQRKRDLNRDWLYEEKSILSFAMSETQWGAFVSSFGQGGGVPATLTRYFHRKDLPEGLVPKAPFASRLNESHKEVRNAGTRALAEVQAAQIAVQEAFDQNLGKKVMRERLSALHHAVRNAPSNMEFAAESLTEHVENVVTKARADIEATAAWAARQGELESGANLFLPSDE